jgi:RNA polymerase primary sigma factor
MRQLKITKQVTNRETASLDKYLQEIGKVDLITADEELYGGYVSLYCRH